MGRAARGGPRAREYFEGARDQVLAARRTSARAESVKERGALRAGGMPQAGGPPGSGADPMDLVGLGIDLEARAAGLRRSAALAVAEGRAALYGPDGRGGLAALMGDKVADAIDGVYLRCEPWAEAAARLGLDEGTCRLVCDAGFARIDEAGWAAVRGL